MRSGTYSNRFLLDSSGRMQMLEGEGSALIENDGHRTKLWIDDGDPVTREKVGLSTS